PRISGRQSRHCVMIFCYAWTVWDGSGRKYGGESGIRTHVRVSPKHAFQACAFSHSAISPTTSLLNLTQAPTLEWAGTIGKLRTFRARGCTHPIRTFSTNTVVP